MTRENTDTCASCKEFDIERARDNDGIGRCGIYDRPQMYNESACGPLYIRDVENLAARYAVVKLLLQSDNG